MNVLVRYEDVLNRQIENFVGNDFDGAVEAPLIAPSSFSFSFSFFGSP